MTFRGWYGEQVARTPIMGGGLGTGTGVVCGAMWALLRVERPLGLRLDSVVGDWLLQSLPSLPTLCPPISPGTRV